MASLLWIAIIIIRFVCIVNDQFILWQALFDTFMATEINTRMAEFAIEEVTLNNLNSINEH